MNTYNYKFAVNCPNDGELITYDLEIICNSKIMVEHIKSACALMKNKHHEDIADYLITQLGGEQTIRATHQGVAIVTTRKIISTRYVESEQ